MGELSNNRRNFALAAGAVTLSVGMLYAPVLAKLGVDWWSDENYSHGLLVPFVIAFIVWDQRSRIASKISKSKPSIAWTGIAAALVTLLAGTLGAELFTQRISLVLMLAAVTVYFFGRRVLSVLAVPFVLLLFAIPIPQIVFNRIAMPLQMLASQMAVWGIRLFEVPTVRKGNVIDILPKGGIQPISLEVVEACSGIRSLMTLITLAVILGYVTRRRDSEGFANLGRWDLIRAGLLVLAAVPIAVLTNAARVTVTGVMTYEYGKQATGAAVHDASGWLVYVVALGLLIALNFGLRKALPMNEGEVTDPVSGPISIRTRNVGILCTVLIAAALGINMLAFRSEMAPNREPLSNLPARLGDWRQRGGEMRFSKESEAVLRASDYTMREYESTDGRLVNVYVGYYATQRTGTTYHSPQNCLPGAGWTLSEPSVQIINTRDGRTFEVNSYIVENGVYREVMIYWYQGRGRIETSEFRDKLSTMIDSVSRRRTDGAMIRVMTSAGDDVPAAITAAADLARDLEDNLQAFVPN